MKRPWHSRTLWANFIVAGVYLLVPGFDEWVKENSGTYTALLVVLNSILRVITKEEIQVKGKGLGLLLACLLATSCAEMPTQDLSPELFHRRDLELRLSGNVSRGTLVTKKGEHYTLEVRSPSKNVDLITFSTCHRDFSFDRTQVGWTGANSFKYEWSPAQGLEDSGYCPMQVSAFDAEGGRHSFGFVDFMNGETSLPATLLCNGSMTQPGSVSVCQSKRGLFQRIEFGEHVRVLPDSGCTEMKEILPNSFEYEIARGLCVYAFMSDEGRVHRLTTLGYEGTFVETEQ